MPDGSGQGRDAAFLQGRVARRSAATLIKARDPMRRKFLLVFNPTAGPAGRTLLGRVVSALRERGADVTPFEPGTNRVPTPPDVLAGRYEAVIAAGGDGIGHHLFARQRTLEASVAWSYQLLDAEAQRMFRRLSVFAGSFPFGAAVSIGLLVEGVPSLGVVFACRLRARVRESARHARFPTQSLPFPTESS